MLLAGPVFYCRAEEVRSDTVLMDLPSIYRLADEQSRTIRISETALRAAEEGVRQAKNNLLPHVSVDLSGSYIGDATLLSRGFSRTGNTEVILPGLGPQSVPNGRQSSPHWGNMLSVDATQVIYAGGALSAGVELAKLGERMAELDVAKSRQEVRFMLTGYYLDLVRLGNQIAVIDNHIELTQEVLGQMRSREKVGVVLHNDITRYELQLQQLLLTRVRLNDARDIISHQLATALHLTQGAAIIPDTVPLAKEYAALQDAVREDIWQSGASGSNLMIRQAEAGEKISEQQVKVTRAASIPTIAAVIKDQLFGPYTTDLIPVNANVNAWYVGIGLHYDLGSIWHNRRSIRKARVELENAREKTELVRENIDNQVHAAYVNFLTAFTDVETQRKQVQLADENYAVVQKRYDNDLALLTDLLDASSMKLQADMALVNARIGLLYDYYQLKYITHTL